MALCLALLASFAQVARADEAKVPVLTQRVTDLTHTLSADTVTRLTATLAGLEKKKGAQIAVLMVPSTDGDTIEHYARRVFDQWKLGRKNVDDGILFVIAKKDHTMRIEVGYGLEGAVPDILAGRIIREQVAPAFRKGDFDQGVSAGVDSLVKLVNGETLPPVKQTARQDTGSAPLPMLLPLVFMAFVLPPAGAAFAAALFVFFMFGSVFLACLGAMVGFVLALAGRAARAGGRRNSLRASRNGAMLGGIVGGWGGGMGGGFGGGGGLGGGGGFGGGGGGSGGGGASGGW
ncbi:MAG TPA: YgcG family protein [Burkholderiaceae bacterium]|nr:YgcG family protein [Burkholderiaceae bacterium]